MVLVAGASGALGLEILKLLKQKDLPIRALVHSEEGASRAALFTSDIWKAGAEQGHEVEGITKGVSTIISALGKSISLFNHDEKSFMENDFEGNKNVLRDAAKHDVSRVIYVSIKGADTAREFEVAKAHGRFEEELRNSGFQHTIIRPVGFFSGLNDLAIIAKRKVIPIVGSGEAKTNSIHQKDLAEVVVGYLHDGPEVIDIGGPLIHTRLEMAEMVREKFGGKIVKIPEKLADIGMVLPEMISKNTSAKLDYFRYVTTNDMIGEKRGSITFKEYLNHLDLNQLP